MILGDLLAFGRMLKINAIRPLARHSIPIYNQVVVGREAV